MAGWDKLVCRVAVLENLSLSSCQRGALVSQLPSGKPAVVRAGPQALRGPSSRRAVGCPPEGGIVAGGWSPSSHLQEDDLQLLG